MKILLTGRTGFVGRRLYETLRLQDHVLHVALREKSGTAPPFTDTGVSFAVGNIDACTNWTKALSGCDVVVHLAARAHVMDERETNPLAAFRKVNVDGTLNLARQAAKIGIKRFVFASSVKVNGEMTRPGKPFSASDIPAPEDPYGISKMEAELGLREIAGKTGMEVVIVRPPLVYGPGVKANFARMVEWLLREKPLPLGSVTGNRRSFVALDNLVDLLLVCIDHPAAANQTFLVSDGEDLSTTDLLGRLCRAMNKRPLLLPVPPVLLQLGAGLLGKGDVARRLLGSLQVDISRTRDMLGWMPPVSVDEGLRRVVTPFLQEDRLFC